MKTLMSALLAMAVLAGIAAPASAFCAPGYAEAYDTCVQTGGGG
jgi:hypothetical protein